MPQLNLRRASCVIFQRRSIEGHIRTETYTNSGALVGYERCSDIISSNREFKFEHKRAQWLVSVAGPDTHIRGIKTDWWTSWSAVSLVITEWNGHGTSAV